MDKVRASYELETIEQLRVYADELRMRIVDQLALRAMTVTQLAELLGEAPNKLHYHVRELERVGLVKKVKTRDSDLVERAIAGFHIKGRLHASPEVKRAKRLRNLRLRCGQVIASRPPVHRLKVGTQIPGRGVTGRTFGQIVGSGFGQISRADVLLARELAYMRCNSYSRHLPGSFNSGSSVSHVELCYAAPGSLICGH